MLPQNHPSPPYASIQEAYFVISTHQLHLLPSLLQCFKADRSFLFLLSTDSVDEKFIIHELELVFFSLTDYTNTGLSNLRFQLIHQSADCLQVDCQINK
ncbi:hypothetical protein M5689_000551 [Euphorbia peplus]|nr:hypothetical protein M5689_000551 [Euphorbia peplus]